MTNAAARGWSCRRLLTVLTVAVATCGLAGATSATAAARAPAAEDLQTTATFNTPDNNNIIPHLESLIDRANGDSEIRFTSFSFGDKGIAEALVDAHDEGAKVQVLVDGAAPELEKSQFDKVKTGLHDNGSWARACEQEGAGDANSSCQGRNAMHNKFVLLKDIEGADYVVSTGSANLLGRSSGRAQAAPSDGYYDSWYTDVGHKDLHDRYKGYFDDLVGMQQNLDYFDESSPENPAGDILSYFYPRTESGQPSTAVEKIDAANCADGGAIRVGHWSLSRPAIADKLIEKAKEGCSTAVVLRKIGEGPCLKLAGAIEDGTPNLSLRVFHPGTTTKYMHNKDMLIDAGYPNTTDRQKVVFTGSYNLNTTSEYNNDENLMQIMNNDRIYRQFLENWEHLKAVTSDSDTAVHVTKRDHCNDLV